MTTLLNSAKLKNGRILKGNLMYFITPENAIEYLFKSFKTVDQDVIIKLYECLNKGLFTQDEIEYFFDEDCQAKIIESQGDVTLLNEEVTLNVVYKADDYEFSVTVETLMDLRDEHSRTMMGKLIASQIKQSINEYGEIIAIERSN